MTYSILDLKALEAVENPAYIAAVKTAGTINPDGTLTLPKPTLDSLKRQHGRPIPARGLGDVVATIAQPIARAIDQVAGTRLQTCSACKHRQALLNAAVPFNANKP